MPPRKKLPPKLTTEQLKTIVLGTPNPEPQQILHLSYSGRSKYEGCPKAYELAYVMGAPKKGAVWFVGGKAVHAATEAWDRAQVAGKPVDLPAVWRQAFAETLEESKASDPEFMDWRRAGVKKDNPQGEDLGHWYSVLGPRLVESYIAWRMRSPWKIHMLESGEPAIELDITTVLPGMQIPIRGALDRVFYDEQFKMLRIVDLKTGSRKPDSALQFGVYRATLEHRYGLVALSGAAFMNRQGYLAEPFLLDKYTPGYVGSHFAQIYAAIQAGSFAPKVGRECGMCDVSAACYANDGPLAQQYDRDHPARPPF